MCSVFQYIITLIPGKEGIKQNKTLRVTPVKSTEVQGVPVVGTTDKPKRGRTNKFLMRLIYSKPTQSTRDK